MNIRANADLNFYPKIHEFLQDRREKFYTTLSGGNNSGKSLVLKNMKSALSRKAYMASPQRFYHVHELSTQRFDLSDYDNWESNFVNTVHNEEHNHEQNFIDLGRIIGGLGDKKRKSLFEICGRLIGSKFSLKKRDEDNELSPRYVDMDGQNLSVGSTGTRLLMTLIGLCLDENFEYLLVDEPELGLSPRVQLAVANFFADQYSRKEYFPHLKGIFVATHSHIFLDKSDITNNFIISKEAKDIRIDQIMTINLLHNLQFNLLGNSLESMFLPAAIVICEGKTDKPYIERLVQAKFPGRKILVIEGQGDVKRIFRSFSQSIGDIAKSPFRDRTFIVLDSVHTKGTKEALIALGANTNNIVIWDKNGIEYVYPQEIVAAQFSASIQALSGMTMKDDEISLNGITIRKIDLCERVVADLSSATVFPEELNNKFLLPLALSIGGAD